MAGNYSTEALVSAVRLRGYIPPLDDGITFPKDSDVIALANQEMMGFLVPWVLEAREGHFITTATIPLIAQQASYSLPSRCAGSDISAVYLVDANGSTVFPGLVESDLEVAAQYPANGAVFGQPTRYYFRGNQMVLVPSPSDATLSLQVYYPQRPNQLVPTASVGVITAAAQVGGTYGLTFSGAPTGFIASASYEVVHANPGFEIVVLGVPTGVTTTTATFTGTLPVSILVGDSLCLQDTANYPTNVPADIYLGLFADWISLRFAEIRGDSGQLERASTVFKRSEKLCRMAYLGKRDRLGHRKVSAASNRSYGRRPLYWVK